MFEHGPTIGREVPSFGSALLFSAALDAAAEPRSAEQPGNQPAAFDLSCPFIVSDPNLAQVSEQPEVKAAVTGFNAMWKTSRFRTTPGRALQKLVSDAGAMVTQELTKFTHNLALPLPAEDVAPELLASLAPGVFAVAFGSEAANTEKDGLPSLRLTVCGTRQVVLMPAPWAAGKLLGLDMTKPDGTQRMCQAALNMTQEKVVEAARTGNLWFATIGPGDLLYTPAGWLTCEAVAGSSAGGRPRDAWASGEV